MDELLIPPLFSPKKNYYVGYSTMFNYYGFTEQIFQTVYVLNTSLGKYRVNLGRKDSEIKDMRLRIEAELFDVLTPDERKNFDLNTALTRINKAMENVT